MSTHVCDIPQVYPENDVESQPDLLAIERMDMRSLVGSIIVLLSGAIALAAAIVLHL